MGKKLLIFLSGIIICMTGGCGALLPSTKQHTGSSWNSFDEAKEVFDKITPYETTARDLEKFGFDPLNTPNLEILTYLDITQRFMSNPSITEDDLAEGVQDCLAAKEDCRAHEFTLKQIKEKRQGNVLLDIFRFRRETKTSGWKFQPLIVMKDDMVTYKMWSGIPNISKIVEEKNPLGPLQNSGDVLNKLADLL